MCFKNTPSLHINFKPKKMSDAMSTDNSYTLKNFPIFHIDRRIYER